ncbi:alpha/beta hydrolase family protein [Helicobacter trogontum]|uniref:Methyltransferase n=1 Tax=Helicobacter trogontum TaxID=50960 RepID=A0A4U8S230_9HELI|nr:methyltransferase [Helicobacter trogontum]TLD79677.1 methyltransferase [Helicobacter trogontum]
MLTNKEMIKRFRDYADIADASYAMLHYVYESIDSANPNKAWLADNISLGDKIKKDIDIMDKQGKAINTKKQGENTTYARAIEARLCKEMINDENKQIKSINDISLQARISQRTKNFVNRYELVHHIPNTLSGYSSTIFYDMHNKDYIIAFRGTESKKEIM